MTLKPYPVYKPSGVAWLGLVPESWSVEQIRRRARLRTEKAAYAERKVVLENIESWTGRFREVENADYSGEGIAFSEGDILFGKLRPYLAKAWRADSEGAAVGDFHVYSLAREVEPRFFQYMILSADFVSLVDGSTYGAKMPRASWDFIGSLVEAFPSTDEQRQIADYLDAQTAKIDALIGKQERLIERLAERRQAAIGLAVTHGLDPNASMKDSGVEWLGLVPTHWKVGSLKHYGRLSTGSTPSTDVPENFHASEGRPWFRPQDIDPTIRGANGSLFLSALGQDGATTIAPGSVLVVSTAWSISKIGYTAVECATNQQITAIQSPACGEYLYFLLKAARDEILASMVINRLPIIGNARLGSIALPIPPLDEQRAIVQEVDALTSRIDTLAAKAREMIDVLKERRQALISAAVTGKIDVRGLA